MRTIEEIMDRCVITDDGHWLWKGALRPDGRANIYAPNYTKGGMTVQHGPRAVWHCHTGKPIPAGWRAYGICDEMKCCNPAHVRCTSDAEFGQWVRRTGKLKGQTARIFANRATLRKRSVVNPDLIFFIQTSDKTGVALAAELGLSKQVVSKARRGEYVIHRTGDMFSQLINRQAA